MVASRHIVDARHIGIGTADHQAMHHIQASESDLYTMLVSTGSDANQYIISVSSKGITDFHQTNIQNFVVENRTSNPENPATGQVWICTDDDSTPGNCTAD